MTSPGQDVRLRMIVPPSHDLPWVASASVLLNLHANTLLFNNSDPVPAWDIFSASGSARPVYLSNDDGGPAVSFDGIDDTMAVADTSFMDDLPSFAVFAVLKWASGPNSSVHLGKADYTNPNQVGWQLESGWGDFIIADSGTAWVESVAINPIPANSITDQYFIIAGEVINRGLVHAYQNGYYDGQNDSAGGTVLSYSNSQPFSLSPGGYGNFTKENYKAILCYVPAPNAADRQAIIGWLAAQYGITLP